MSRSGYSDDIDSWELVLWRGAVTSAIRGKRGQAFLREMLDALDTLPKKRLIASELEEKGEVCAIGSVTRKRGINVEGLDPTDSAAIARIVNIAPAMASEIVFVNDDDFGYRKETPEERFTRVRAWVAEHIRGEETG